MRHTNRQFSQQDRIVVVMGPTGAGKSTFIECATRQDGKSIGHSWKSQTSAVRFVRTMHPISHYPVVFVDTPGLDDTFKSDIEILTIIADWLVNAYKSNVNLSSILYLHRISDNRMSGSAMKNLRLFSSLCGQQAMPSVVIVSTMWSVVSAEWATKREVALKQDVWRDMLANGCIVKRFTDTYESAWDIVGSVTHSEPISIVKEIAHGRSILETNAGMNCNDRQDSEEAKRLLKKIRRGFSKWFGWGR